MRAAARGQAWEARVPESNQGDLEPRGPITRGEAVGGTRRPRDPWPRLC